MDKKVVIAILTFLHLIGITSAATIYGHIYDLSLNKVDNARVEINTMPKQHYVAKNGSYSFNVPIGDYSIRAIHYSGNILEISTENISVKDSGNYVLDIVLFPSLEEEKELLKETGVSIVEEKNTNLLPIYFFAGSSLLAISVIAVVAYLFTKRRKPKTPPQAKDEKDKKEIEKEKQSKGREVYDAEEIIKILKEEGGRTTQKDIRKKIPLSEAKISLMISELEAKGAIKKIKKGRGNILIINK